ncbi:hypothetical protein CU669_00215 [Paramagnetospirillum kuznetsovii]|uniref:ABC transporter ATP-binding protein n=1 Tax=Paramagnetospirillum kuznetsovii TaxID=2053833 RepID=A0A364P322_9PROT|nr:ATP-binding cassette domain-containing protein [Paramagnetospirillum kuznetsovii]RAU23567.1 hypothetical protein CU669_00215 [Paramagnetospirillum kuznetsovii]
MLRTLTKLTSLLAPTDRIRVLLLLLPMAIAAVLELLGIGLLFGALQVAFGGLPPGGVATAWIGELARVVDVNVFMLGVGAFFLVKNAVLLLLTWLTNSISAHLIARFQAEFFGNYLRLPYTSYLETNTASFIQNLQIGTPQALDTVRVVLSTVLEVLLAGVTVALLLAVEPVLSLAGGAVLLTIGIGFQTVAGPMFRRWGQRSYEHELRFLTLAKESFAAIRDVQLAHCQDYLSTVYARDTHANARYYSLSNTNHTTARILLESGLVLGILAMVMMVSRDAASAGGAVATAGLFGIAAMRLLPSANRILNNLTEIRRRDEVIGRVHADLEAARTAVRTADQAVDQTGDAPVGGKIEILGLRFRYGAAESDALDGIDLTIAEGEAVGIVGASGSGKSTLVDVVMGLLSPSVGSIRVGGVDVLRRRRAWQSRIGYVPQRIQLLDDSLRRNIAFGLPDEAIDDRQVRSALALAQLDDVVSRLPLGLDTPMGEHGARLSGGQRQRVGIARALYRDPDVLVFDEATSALDNETEREVIDAIRSFKGRKTILIIAHRLTTVRDCDRVLLMRQGAIADTGTLAQLADRHPELAGAT